MVIGHLSLVISPRETVCSNDFSRYLIHLAGEMGEIGDCL